MTEKKSSYYLLSVVLIAGFVLRCWNIHQSFWWDEIWSTLPYAGAPRIWDTVSSLGYYFNNHILYSLCCRLSCAIFGISELSARLPALIMGLLGIFFLFHLGKNAAGTLPALLASLLLAVSAFHIDHASEARGYSGLLLFSLLASMYYLHALTRNTVTAWTWYTVFTVLGLYMHVCMVLVVISQTAMCAGALIFKKLRQHIGMHEGALRSFMLSVAAACITTLILYSPVILTFLRNMKKVRVVSVNRLPFIFTLADCNFPGITSLPGCMFHGVVLSAGLVFLVNKNRMLLVYAIVILLLPLSLYLLVNPMFVFERYFIFILPFSLLLAGCGIVQLSTIAAQSTLFRSVIIAGLIITLTIFNAPDTLKTMTQDRQNYREAIGYVEQQMGSADTRNDFFVFSLGWAGDYFQYYAHVPVCIPKSFDEFIASVGQKQSSWCLITAWLPDMRPPGEDTQMYAERLEHEQIYAYVLKHFVLAKDFPSRYPTRVYKLGKKAAGAQRR